MNKGRASADKLPPWLLGLAVAAVTLAVFRPAIDLPWCSFDDGDYITDNPAVKAGLSWAGLRWAFSNTVQGHWHPLTTLSLMLDVSLFGVRPDWTHFVNAALHAASAGLLASALAGATAEAWPSLLAALLFALHPLRVESVAWAAERKDVLSVFFAVAATAAYLRFGRSRSRKALASVHLLFAASLLSKATAVALPFAFLLLDAWPLCRWGKERPSSLVVEKAGLAAIAAAFCAISLSTHRHGMMISIDALPLSTRLEHAPVAYLQYLSKSVWPWPLALFYPYPDLPFWKWAGALAVLSAATALAWRLGRREPAVRVGWLWFLGTFVPLIGLVQLGGQSIADRYSYLPHVGLAIAAAWGAAAVARRLPSAGPGVAAAALAALAASARATTAQIRVWASPKLLYERSLSVSPTHFHLNNLLGRILADEGDLRGAQARFLASIAAKPDYPFARSNLGLLLEREGRPAEALPQLEAAVRLMPGKPQFRMDYGLALERSGRLDEAERELEKAVELDPSGADARSDLGNLLFRLGRADEAVRQYREALRLEPANADAHNNLGIVLAARGETKEAVSEFTAALRLRPGFEVARRNLALAASSGGSPVSFDESVRWR